MIVIGFGLRWLYNRSVVAEVDQQKKTMSKIAEAAKEVDLYASNMKLKVPVDESKSHIELATENNLVTEVVQDQQQYDAAQDFAIFGMSDKTQGGLQTLQEKMNQADEHKSIHEDIQKISEEMPEDKEIEIEEV